MTQENATNTTTSYNEPQPNLEADFVHTTHKATECNDVFFLLLFLGVFIMTIVFAIAFGEDFIDAATVHETIEGSVRDEGFAAVLEYLSYTGLSAIGMSIAWIVIMVLAGECLIWLALFMIIGTNAAIAVLYTKYLYDEGSDNYWWPAAVFGTIAILTALYAFCVRKHIRFAAKHLKVSGSCVFTLPMMIGVAMVMVCVEFAWVITWFVGLLGILYNSDYIRVPTCTTDDCDIETDVGSVIGVTLGMLLVFFWASFVIQNIVHVTVAGSVASWRIKSNAPLITVRSWVRALTLSLGSICFGSLLVAILETIKQMFNFLAWMAGDSGNCVASCIFGCASCIIGCIQNLVEFFNRFAYSYVGIYGYSFLTAGKHTAQLFMNKGWSAIVNDNLTGNVFLLAKLVVAGLSSFIGVRFAQEHKEDDLRNIEQAEMVLGTSGFLIGYAIAMVIMSIMESAVTTVFVLWAEDPHGWQICHPNHYQDLHEAWLESYPDEYNDGHGKANNQQVAHV